MNLFIKTYGCQANISDSEQIAGILKQHNHNIVKNEPEADIIVINSCSVKNKTQSKILHYIHHFINNHPKNKDKKIIIGGCLPKTLNLRKRFPEITAVFDPNTILRLPEIIKNPKDISSNKKENRISSPILRKNKETTIIQISQGCLNSCSFCATKLARGNLYSYRIGDIKRALEKSIKQCCKKIYITSQDNSCYGFDIKTSLPELLDELVKVKGNYKIRVGMMNPWHLNKIKDKLINSYKSEKIIKFLHVPIQSGSEKVLKHMRRHHKINDFKASIKKFRKTFPNISIATDIIVGYPTETEQDFKQTLNLIKQTKPNVLNISTFSSRSKTKASKLKQLSSQTIKERSRKLTEFYYNYKKII